MPAMHSVIPTNYVSSASRRNTTVVREKNVLASIFSAMVIVLLILALALPNWYYLKGGGCDHEVLGAEPFFHITSFESNLVSKIEHKNSHSQLAFYGPSGDLEKCITPDIITIQRVVIGLCFLTMIFSFIQFFFDIAGISSTKFLKCSKRCSLGSIVSVMTIVVIIGLYYYTSDLMEHQQEITKLYPATRVEVTFGISYYLIATAGIVSVLATASNLFKCDHLTRSNDASMLLDDHQEEETFSIALPHSQSWSYIHEQNSACMSNLPPPPPYTP